MSVPPNKIEWPSKEIRLSVTASALREISRIALESVTNASAQDGILLQIIGLAETALVFEPKVERST